MPKTKEKMTLKHCQEIGSVCQNRSVRPVLSNAEV